MESSTPNEARAPENGPSFSGDYWNGINPIYSTAASEQPFGIGWDHPVFRTSQPPPEDQNIYSQPPQQSWQQQPQLQPSMAPESQSYTLPPQYGVQQHHYPQGHTHFDPQSNSPAPYPTYSFDPQPYYSNQSIPAEGTFNQSPAPVLQRHVEQQPAIPANALQSPLPSYNSPANAHANIQVCSFRPKMWTIKSTKHSLGWACEYC
jgi:hypothetical protein